LGVSVEVFL